MRKDELGEGAQRSLPSGTERSSIHEALRPGSRAVAARADAGTWPVTMGHVDQGHKSKGHRGTQCMGHVDQGHCGSQEQGSPWITRARVTVGHLDQGRGTLGCLVQGHRGKGHHGSQGQGSPWVKYAWSGSHGRGQTVPSVSRPLAVPTIHPTCSNWFWVLGTTREHLLAKCLSPP